MTIEHLAPGFFKATDGEAALFVGVCDEGCSWLLFPEPRGGAWHWTAQHGESREAVRVLGQSGASFDPAAVLAALEDWLDECHAYEGLR